MPRTFCNNGPFSKVTGLASTITGAGGNDAGVAWSCPTATGAATGAAGGAATAAGTWPGAWTMPTGLGPL
eukprot:CAMPEP_0183564482 /NCGR_PEP_ID=MMETSP0371-20130417/105639_1 /TAXON_ID=268820 /ORGANISM="Peridinium aciculiferum, Strain PAER-2" /LENGTH=69 /DNA_ID=CAMNT_0025773513 /DNA_START=58 /DNA_END=264 /DNA_ORIENTATION=+